VIVRVDDCLNPDPIPLWHKIESAYPEQNASNPQVRHLKDPDLGPCRELILTDKLQSLYDKEVRNDSYRTQLISNSDTNTFYPLENGKRYLVRTRFKLQSPTRLRSDRRSTDSSQIFQIKNTGSGPKGTRKLILSLVETKTKMEFGINHNSKFVSHWKGTAPKGKPITFVLDCLFAESGQFCLLADFGSGLKPLTGTISARTAFDSEAIGKLSIGPYQNLSTPAVTRRYGPTEVEEVLAA
jgi:hypothetical protein